MTAAPLPPCKGMNCGTTDFSKHSPECEAQHAAAIAGGYFVKLHSHAWIVETNTDLTEGRGRQQITHVAAQEATAARLAKGKYVMGSDCPIRRVELLLHNGRLYGPVTPALPSKEDERAQLQLASRRAAEAKARAAGLSDEEIRALEKQP